MSAAKLLALARPMNITLTTAESCTGGLLAAAITTPPGASDIFREGYVTYSNESKMRLLGVRAQALDSHGAVSEVVAREMAEGARARARADFALSVTGIAGPGGSQHKPEGRVCFGCAHSGKTHTETIEFGALGRDRVRAAAVEHALGLLLTTISLANP